MNIKKAIASTGAAILVGGGLALATSFSASATETEQCVPYEGKPAWVEVVADINHPAIGEPTIDILNPDYVAPTYVAGYWEKVPASYTPAQGEPKIVVTNPDYVPEVAEQPATYETLYKFVHKWDVLHLNPKWKADPNWNAEGNPNSHGWHFTGDTKPGKELTPAVPYQPAVGTPTIEIDNPDYVPASYTPETEVWVEPIYTPGNGLPEIITVTNPDYVEAWTEVTPDIQHEAIPAVECEPVAVPEEPAEPTTPEQPAPVQPAAPEQPSEPSAKTLPVTGGAPSGALLAGGSVVGLLGAALMAFTAVRRQQV